MYYRGKLQVNGSFSAKQIFVEDKNLLTLITEMQTEISDLKKILGSKMKTVFIFLIGFVFLTVVMHK